MKLKTLIGLCAVLALTSATAKVEVIESPPAPKIEKKCFALSSVNYVTAIPFEVASVSTSVNYEVKAVAELPAVDLYMDKGKAVKANYRSAVFWRPERKAKPTIRPPNRSLQI